jgi:PmbA protein
VHEAPHLLRGLASASFDNEGVATYPHDIVHDGVLENYLLSTYSARRLGLSSTGNAGGVHNLIVHSAQGMASFGELLAELGEGLVVSSVMGQGVNLVTGDYSRGASGFYVAGGKIQYPVDEITIAGQLPQLLQNIRAIGSDIERQSSIQLGSLLIDGFTIASAEHPEH